MDSTTWLLMLLYRGAIRLYPKPFQAEYGQEMADTWQLNLLEAVGVSTWSVWILCLRELRDLPENLFQEHCAELWRRMIEMQDNSIEPKSKSVFRGVIGFGLSFTFIYLLYAILDSKINSGKTLLDYNTVWSCHYLHPAALACGVGAIILGIRSNKRRVWISALLGFLGYTLVHVTLSFLINPSRLAEPGWLYYLVYPLAYMIIIGAVVGGCIGYNQGGWRKTIRFAFAGAVGFTIGWTLDRLASTAILQISPTGGYISRLIIGSPLYFIYILVPVLIYGISIGLAMGAASAKKAEPNGAASVKA